MSGFSFDRSFISAFPPLSLPMGMSLNAYIVGLIEQDIGPLDDETPPST